MRSDRVKMTLTTAATSTTSALAVAANSSRAYLIIQNRGGVAVYVKFGSAHSGTEGIELAAGVSYEPYKVPIDSIYLKAASGTPSVTIYEGE